MTVGLDERICGKNLVQVRHSLNGSSYYYSALILLTENYNNYLHPVLQFCIKQHLYICTKHPGRWLYNTLCSLWVVFLVSSAIFIRSSTVTVTHFFLFFCKPSSPWCSSELHSPEVHLRLYKLLYEQLNVGAKTVAPNFSPQITLRHVPTGNLM